jgi:transmembrane sensor
MDANDRRARATEEATQWWTRLGTKAPADVSETDREEFTQWLRESPLHVAELLQVAHVHDALERFKLWDEIPLETLSEDNNITVLPSPIRVRGEGPGCEDLKRRGRRVRFFLAASVCLIAVATGWLALRSSETTIATDRAERREVALNDGSVVNLEPETLLRINFGLHQRYIVLTRGRALFHVAKDPARPFIVHAGDTQVRAVGTIFGVEQKDQNIIVTVSEGKVGVIPTSQFQTATARSNSAETEPAQREGEVNYGEVGALDASHFRQNPHPRPLSSRREKRENSAGEPSGIASGLAGEVFLTANQQITVRKSGDSAPVQEVDSSRALAWSEGRLVFDSTPLKDVADEFNRYNRVQLHINGPDLARRTISGVFRASDPETLIDFIGAGAHVVVTRKGNEEIVISPGP